VFFPDVQNKNQQTKHFIPILSILTFSSCLWIFYIQIGKIRFFFDFLEVQEIKPETPTATIFAETLTTLKNHKSDRSVQKPIFGSGQACEKNELGLIAFVDATGQTPSSLKNHKSVDATGPNP
jgi:hypothetical protein